MEFGISILDCPIEQRPEVPTPPPHAPPPQTVPYSTTIEHGPAADTSRCCTGLVDYIRMTALLEYGGFLPQK